MLKLSKLTDYGVVVLARLSGEGAVPGGQVQTAPGLALTTGIAEPTVAKVLKILAQAGLVEGVRGAHGGYRAEGATSDAGDHCLVLAASRKPRGESRSAPSP